MTTGRDFGNGGRSALHPAPPAVSSALPSLLPAFLPSFFGRIMLRQGQTAGPREARVPAAVLFADMSGFTRLSQQLADRAPGGPEELQGILNRWFGGLAELIRARGGEVAYFAGDAVFALWPAEHDQRHAEAPDDEAHDDGQTDLRRLVLRASACAVAARTEMDGVAVTEGFRLRLRLAVAAGTTWMVTVGGVGGRWCFLTAGAPLRQIARAAVQARAGDVILSPEARSLVGAAAAGEPTAGGCLRLVSLAMPSEVETLAAAGPAVAAESGAPGALGARDADPEGPYRPDSDGELAAYLPRAVRELFRAGQNEWLGEYRRVTTVFVNLADLDDSAPDALARLQRLATALQDTTYRYGGSVNQLLTDDKGTTLVAAWGLSLHAHEDDAARAVQAGLGIRRELARLGIAAAVGIATGRIFAGTRGTRGRLEYGLMGESVNLAARLMAAAPDSILCDAPTRAAARGAVVFEALPPLAVRGLSEAVPVFRPLGERDRGTAGGAGMVGRAKERADLASALAALEREGRSGLILIEGQPGIGKSVLLRDLLARTQSSSVRGFLGAGEALERASAYNAWRAIFGRLLRTDGDAAGRQRAVERALDALPGDLRARGALLSSLLPFTLPGLEAAEQMTAAGRADATRALGVALLKQAAAESPLLVVIEDAQWLDSASWGLLEAAWAEIDRLLLVVATRPVPERDMAMEHRRITDNPSTVHVRLQPLQPEEALAVACRRLQVDGLPPEVAALVHEKAEGHPLFIEELVSSLRDRGIIAARDGDCVLGAGASRLEALGVSNTVQGIITTRIDQLNPAQQLTLKVASVLGRRFSVAALASIHPLAPGPREIEAQLGVMLGLELVRRASAAQAPAVAPASSSSSSSSSWADEYLFHHSTIEEVAYGLLPLAQRRELHASAARWYGGGRAGEVPASGVVSLAVLAHHWTRADDIPKALDVLERAGEQALRSGLFREAVSFFGEALGRANREPPRPDREKTGASVSALRQARWERQLSRGYFGLGQEADCRQFGEASVARLRRAVPRSSAGVRVALVGELLRQGLHGLLPGGLLRWKTARDPEIQGAARAFHALSYAYYLDQQGERLLHAVLRTANLAERLEASGELARAYGALAYMAGAYGLVRASRAYQRRAVAVAERIGRPLVRADVLYISALSRIANGEWDRLRADMSEAQAIFERMGERRSVLDVQLMGNYAAYNGGELARAAEAYGELRLAASRAGAGRNEYLAAGWEVGTALRRGRLGEAQAALRSVERLPRDRGAELSLLGFLAVARWRQGDAALALQAAEQGRALIEAHTYTAPYSFEGYRDIAEIYLSAWETAAAAGESPADLPEKARLACLALRRFARGCRISQPAAWLQQGRAEWLAGHPRRAQRCWRRALDLASALRLPFEEGLAHLELGRRRARPGLPLRRDGRRDDPRGPRDEEENAHRSFHLKSARDLFARIGAEHELARMERPMERP